MSSVRAVLREFFLAEEDATFLPPPIVPSSTSPNSTVRVAGAAPHSNARPGSQATPGPSSSTPEPSSARTSSRDPLVDIVHQFPGQAVWFIKIAMMFGSVTGALVCVPCVLFLGLYWERCSECNKPLHWWLLVHTVLLLLQTPVTSKYLWSYASIPCEVQEQRST